MRRIRFVGFTPTIWALFAVAFGLIAASIAIGITGRPRVALILDLGGLAVLWVVGRHAAR